MHGAKLSVSNKTDPHVSWNSEFEPQNRGEQKLENGIQVISAAERSRWTSFNKTLVYQLSFGEGRTIMSSNGH